MVDVAHVGLHICFCAWFTQWRPETFVFSLYMLYIMTELWHCQCQYFIYIVLTTIRMKPIWNVISKFHPKLLVFCDKQPKVANGFPKKMSIGGFGDIVFPLTGTTCLTNSRFVGWVRGDAAHILLLIIHHAQNNRNWAEVPFGDRTPWLRHRPLIGWYICLSWVQKASLYNTRLVL